MLRTERKSDQSQTRQDGQKPQQTRRKQSTEQLSQCAQTLQAILAGGSWELFPAERVRELSHTIGNAALLELLALRETGPELAARPLPAGGVDAAPAKLGAPGPPELTAAPDFGAMAPLGGTAPLTA